VLVLIGFRLFSCVLMWNETRSGFRIDDVVLNNVGPIENHLIIFILTYGLILIGLWNSLGTKDGWLTTNFSIVFFLIFRTITLTLLPLDPPEQIIPLKDYFLTNTFYCSKILVRDLFFSGHTTAVFLLYFLVNHPILKKVLLIGAIVLGTLLVLQHVHYTIDVLVAPLFAYIAYRSGDFAKKKALSLLPNDEDIDIVVNRSRSYSE
jgi:PAP2 superfamily C-terminal